MSSSCVDVDADADADDNAGLVITSAVRAS